MGPILIVKLVLSGLLTAIESAEAFIPDGKLKDVLAQIDTYGKEALAILGQVGAADGEDAKACRAKLSKIPAVKGE